MGRWVEGTSLYKVAASGVAACHQTHGLAATTAEIHHLPAFLNSSESLSLLAFSRSLGQVKCSPGG